VLTPSTGPEPWAVYLPGLRRFPGPSAAVSEIDLVVIANTRRRAGHGRALPRPTYLRPPAVGFHVVRRTTGATYMTLIFKAPRPLRIERGSLERQGLQPGLAASAFFQSPSSRGS